MKAAAALGFTLLLGFVASQALAAAPGIGLPTTVPSVSSVPSVPPLPPPPVTVPTLPVKPPPPPPTTTPKLPPPPTVSVPTTTTVKTPVTTTSVSVTPGASLSRAAPSPTGGATVSSAPHTAAAIGTGSATGGGFGSTPPTTAGAPAGSSAAGVQGLRSSRHYVVVRGKKARRILLTFVLPRASRVYFVVTQLSPGCEVVGRFSIRGRQGLNHVPFYGRIGKRKLQPGTYRIAAHTRRRPTLARITLVVVDHAPTLAQLRTAQAANVCPATSAFASGLGSDGGDSSALPSTGNASNASVVPPRGLRVGSGAGAVLGTEIAKVARALQPLLIALLGIAILLLGAASLPHPTTPMSRFSDDLARHRTALAGLGAAALVGAALAFLLG
jgi:hypothetical protein